MTTSITGVHSVSVHVNSSGATQIGIQDRWCMQLEAQRAKARDLESHVLTKEQSLGKLQFEVTRLSSSVTALR